MLLRFVAVAERQRQVAEIVRQDPNVEALMSFVGASNFNPAMNSGRITITLKPFGQRKNADEVVRGLRPKLARLQGVKAFVQNVPAIRIGGTISTSDYVYSLSTTELTNLYAPGEALEAKLRTIPMLQDVSSNLELRNPEIQIRVLRDRASALGISSQQVELALFNAFGGRQVSTLYGAADQYSIMMELDRKYQSDINALGSLFIQSPAGAMVPLSTLAEVKSGVGPISVAHFGQLPSVILSFNLAPGVSVGDAIGVINDAAAEVVPAGISTSFTGSAKAFQEAFKSLPILLMITIVLIYMILAILYEHYGHPFTILTALPFAGFGALLTLLVFNQELNIFSFVGIILLIGLVKKNGIMMIDFAMQMQREKGMQAMEAIVEACSVRFRPIMMTTGAAIFATLPIALGFGAGAETRRPLGIAVVGGLVFSQFLTLYVTPVFYVSMDRAIGMLKKIRTRKVATVTG